MEKRTGNQPVGDRWMGAAGSNRELYHAAAH